jgi:hypothetical protein
VAVTAAILGSGSRRLLPADLSGAVRLPPGLMVLVHRDWLV